MKYFSGCRTAEEGKALYKELLKKHHPDNGGDTATMQEINEEFRRWWETHKNCHQNAETGETYTRETHESADDFIDILNRLAGLQGLEIEICGSWLWIRGNTFPNKDALKEFGCRFAASKKCWFWTAEQFKKKRSRTQSMERIRQKYGSEKVDLEQKTYIG